MTAQVDEEPAEALRAPGRRASRRVLALVAALVLAAVVVLVLMTRGDDGGDDGDGGGGDGSGAAAAGGTAVNASPGLPAAPSSEPPAPPTPEPVLEGPDALPPTLAPVALDQTAAVGDGVTVDVLGVASIDGTGSGPGNVSGPALRVTVRLTNGTATPISLDGTAVELRSGFDQAPASPLNDPSGAPFSGALDPGASAEGAYVFSVPLDARDAVSVIVEHAPGTPFVVFTGSAG